MRALFVPACTAVLVVGCSSAHPNDVLAVSTATTASTQAPIEVGAASNSPPVQTSVAKGLAPKSAAQQVKHAASITPTVKGIQAPGVGSVLSYRTQMVTLYTTDKSIKGIEVPSADLGAPLSVIVVSDVNKRLKIRTTAGDKWLDPSSVEYSESLSDGQPAFRDKKFVAGGRGID